MNRKHLKSFVSLGGSKVPLEIINEEAKETSKYSYTEFEDKNNKNRVIPLDKFNLQDNDKQKENVHIKCPKDLNKLSHIQIRNQTCENLKDLEENKNINESKLNYEKDKSTLSKIKNINFIK